MVRRWPPPPPAQRTVRHLSSSTSTRPSNSWLSCASAATSGPHMPWHGTPVCDPMQNLDYLVERVSLLRERKSGGLMINVVRAMMLNITHNTYSPPHTHTLSYFKSILSSSGISLSSIQKSNVCPQVAPQPLRVAASRVAKTQRR